MRLYSLVVCLMPNTVTTVPSKFKISRGAPDDALTMDGKTMKNALDEEGRQTHIMSVAGHESKRSYAQKK